MSDVHSSHRYSAALHWLTSKPVALAFIVSATSSAFLLAGYREQFRGYGVEIGLTGIAIAAVIAIGTYALFQRISTVHLIERVRFDRAMQFSEERYDALFQNNPSMLFTLDDEGIVVAVNQSGAAQLGYSPHELIGESVLAVFHEDDRAAVVKQMRTCVLHPQEVYQWQFRKIRRDGSLMWVEEFARAITGPDEATQILVVCADVSARKRVEDALRASERLLHTVFDTLPHPIVVKDAQRRYVMVNRAWSDRYGANPQDVIHKQIGEIPGTDDVREQSIRQDLEVLTGDKDRIATEGTETIAGGRRSHYYAIKASLRDEEGRVTGLVGVTVDITELKQTEEEVRAREQMLSAIFAAVPGRLFVKDTQGRYLKVNRAHAEVVGLSPEEIVGQDFRVFDSRIGIRPETIREHDKHVLETGGRLEIPFQRQAISAGENGWFHVIKVPLRSSTGEIVGLVGLSLDVTQQQMDREELRAERQLLQTIFDSLPVSLFVKDLHGRFLKVNQAQADNYGLTVDEMIGKQSEVLAVRISTDIDAARRQDALVIEKGIRIDVPETPSTIASGQRRWYRIIKVPLRDDAGDTIGVVGMAVDVTDRKEAEDSRLAMERLIQRTQNLESLGVMAGSIAQDFNDLLQRILGHAELAMREMPRAAPGRDSVRMVLDAIQNAIGLTHKMLTLAGDSRFTLETLDLSEFVRASQVELERVVGERVTLVIVPGESVAPILGDTTLIRQVLGSLVNNASESMDSKGGHVTVTTGAERIEPNQLDESYSDRDLAPGLYSFVQVRDTGPGIPPEIAARLYEPFFRTKGIGRSLGLPAVRAIVRGHRGTIRVVSTASSGTTFRVLIPVAAAS